MSEQAKVTSCCCGASPISERESQLIQMAYYLITKEPIALKKAMMQAKRYDITTEDIKELCVILANTAKDSILSTLDIKTEEKKNTCCL